MIQVYFKKSPTGSPFFLAYSQGEHGFVRPQMVDELVKAGVIDAPKEVRKVNAGDFTPAADLKAVATSKGSDLSTEEGVKDQFGEDVQAMQEYCDEHEITYSKAAKRPEYFWSKIAGK